MPILSDLNGDGAAEAMLITSSLDRGRRAYFQVFVNLGDGRFEPGREVFLNRSILRMSPIDLDAGRAILVSIGGGTNEEVVFTPLWAQCLLE